MVAAVAALRAIAYNESALDMTAPAAALENVSEPDDGRSARRATPIAAIFQPSAGDFENAVNEWLDEARSKGEIQSVVLKNMEKLAGVKADAFPKEVKF